MVNSNKNAVVAITCTPEERELFHSKAKAEGLKFTDWARMILLNTTLKEVIKNAE